MTASAATRPGGTDWTPRPMTAADNVDQAQRRADPPAGPARRFDTIEDRRPALAADEALARHPRRTSADCTRCKLCTLGRTQIVFGVGNPKARLMFVGEAPGEDEDKQGEPFVGRAGQLLTKIIEAIGLTREQVYIANVIKCRPPGNRNPEPDEVATCEPFLFRQIDVIQPKVIVAARQVRGAVAAARRWIRSRGCAGAQFDYRGAMLIPTFHPAYLLRNPSAKREVWEDMKKVRASCSQRRSRNPQAESKPCSISGRGAGARARPAHLSRSRPSMHARVPARASSCRSARAR